MADRKKWPKPPLFALLLIAAGVVLLLQNFGVVGWGFWLEIWRFWPALLVAVGVNLILGRRLPWLTTAIVAALVCGSAAGAALLAEYERVTVVATISEPLDGVERLEVSVDLGLGSLTIDSLPSGSSKVVEGSFETPCRPASTSFERYGDAATLDVEMDAGSSTCQWGADWKVSLSRVPEVSIDLGAGAASVDLDLADLRVPFLEMDAGAAAVHIRMPANGGAVEALITAGAADIEVRIPDGVAARVVNDTSLSSFEVASRFTSLEGDVFQSPGYRQAENRVSIVFEGGVSSVSVY